MSMRKFLCTSSWARDTKGDIIELYIYQRYPREIRELNFTEIVPKKNEGFTKPNKVEKAKKIEPENKPDKE